MKKFNFKELLSQLHEESRAFAMADTVSINYKGNFTPIKINGVAREELKTFRGSFCIYNVYDEKKTLKDYDMDVELLVVEEYPDSPFSIYINSKGEVDSYEYNNIHTINIGKFIVLRISDNQVSSVSYKEDAETT